MTTELTINLNNRLNISWGIYYCSLNCKTSNGFLKQSSWRPQDAVEGSRKSKWTLNFDYLSNYYFQGQEWTFTPLHFYLFCVCLVEQIHKINEMYWLRVTWWLRCLLNDWLGYIWHCYHEIGITHQPNCMQAMSYLATCQCFSVLIFLASIKVRVGLIR